MLRKTTMLRKTMGAMLIATLMVGTAAAQRNTPGVSGYTNSVRSNQDKKNDRELDRAYQSTVNGRPDVKKSDPWSDVRPTPPATPPAKTKQ